MGDYVEEAKRNKPPRSVEIFDDDEEDCKENPAQLNQPLSCGSHCHPSSGGAKKRKRASEMSKEELERVHLHIANFFYECGIPLNIVNPRSFKMMIEAMAGPGIKLPTPHDLRGPLLEKSKMEIQKWKKGHVIAWKKFGCTLMVDGWTDRKSLRLINFFVNSPEGTFFLESVDATSQKQDANMLAALLMEKIEKIGKECVVQVVTDNSASFKKAGKLLEQRMPALFWTPCAAHCLYLMLEDIGKLDVFKSIIDRARNVINFIYNHEMLYNAVWEKIGGQDLVRPGITRSATTFLTLQSLCKHKNALRQLFVSRDRDISKLASEKAVYKVCEIVFSSQFWDGVEDCLRAAHPFMIVLKKVDGNEKPALPELAMAMRKARKKLNDCFACNEMLLDKLLDIVKVRWEDWENQMEVKLHGAALFLNPSNYFDVKKDDDSYALELRCTFNDVLMKMIPDRALAVKISDQADDYEGMRGNFAKELAIMQQKTKNPLDWWRAFGGRHFELYCFAVRILGLCCSSFGCERNWSTFESLHTKRNKLEQKIMNDLAYIQYNRKIASRFQKWSKEGKILNPLIFEDFQWENEWANEDHAYNEDHLKYDLLWSKVDEATNATPNLTLCSARDTGAIDKASSSKHENVRCRSTSTSPLTNKDIEEFPNEDEDIDDDDEDIGVFPNDDLDIDDE